MAATSTSVLFVNLVQEILWCPKCTTILIHLRDVECWSLDPWFSRIVERMAISLEFSNIIIIVILITLGKNHCKYPDLIPFFISFWNHLHFCGTESNFESPKIISEVVGGAACGSSINT